jgi:hypothetical protein
MRPIRRSTVLGALIVLGSLVVAIASPPGATAATGGWTIGWTPSTIVEGVSTSIVLTGTNTAGGSSVGCISLRVPSEFSVGAAGVNAVQPAHAWTADPPSAGTGGLTTVKVHAVTEADVLKGDGDSVVFHTTVTGMVPGTYVWPADSLDHANCTSGIDSSSVNIAVVAAGPTPTPVATATPKPTPTPTARPTPTPRPATAAPTVSPTPNNTVTPSAPPTSTPSPTATPATTAGPSEQASIAPGSSPPTASTSPTPTPSDQLEAGAPTFGPPSDGGATGGGAAAGAESPDDGSGATGPLTVAAEADGAGIDASLVATSLTRLDGMVWVVPSLVLTVPGLLLLLAIAAQVAAGAAWVPVVRRKLGPARSGLRVPTFGPHRHGPG